LKSISRNDFILTGFIAKTHGVKGELKLTLDYNIILKEWAFLEIKKKPVPFFIEKFQKLSPSEAIIKLADINSHEEASKLCGYSLLQPKKLLRAKKKQVDTEINGYAIVDIEIGEIGIVEEVLMFPQQLLIKTNYKGKEVLIPAEDVFIQEIDHDNQIVTTSIPMDLLQL